MLLLALLQALGSPISPRDRLAPCAVVLEHRAASYVANDEISWVTHRTPVHRLVRRWEETRAGVDWERNPIAPIPLTRAQARAIPSATESDGLVIFLMEDSSLSYAFDARGRTAEVRFEAGADKGTYRFTYQYACEQASPVRWVD